jgi:hypothetical protein
MEAAATGEQLREGREADARLAAPSRRRVRAGAVAELLAAALPLIGLVSLLLRSQLDPHFVNARLHFVLFGLVGSVAFALGFAAGEAANRRRDARVFLLSLAFMATGGFMGLHALGTPGVLFSEDYAGFKIAIPVGLLVSAVFAAASAFVDLRPAFAPLVVRHRRILRAGVLLVMGAWFVWTVANLPPLRGPNSEAATGSLLAVMAVVGTVVYAVSAARYWTIFRNRPHLLPAAVIACFVLLSEALIGVAVTGERKWHASWWEWHGLIVTAYLIIGFAAHRQWREERFRHLPIDDARVAPARQRPLQRPGRLHQLRRALDAGRGGGSARRVLGDRRAAAHPRVRRRGGEVHRRRCRGALLQARRPAGPRASGRACGSGAPAGVCALAEEHPDWPRMRVGVNSGEAVVHEIGGDGYVAYPLVGDTINTGARLEGLAPVGGVLIGAETYGQLPDGAVVEPKAGLRVKGKDDAVDAYVLLALP